MADGLAAPEVLADAPKQRAGGTPGSGKGRGTRFSLRPTPWRPERRELVPDGQLPPTLWGLAWRIGGGDQVWLCVLAVVVALLDTAPLEVQRRMINHAIKESGLRSIILLALAYAGLAMAQGLVKLLSNLYRSWVSEHAVRILRSYINGRDNLAGASPNDPEQQGVQVSMIVAESEPIGAFMGEIVCEPLLQAGVTISVVGYLVYLQPVIAIVFLGVYLPQIVFVPLMQRAINRRAQARIEVLRQASAGIIGAEGSASEEELQEARFSRVFRLNMGVYRLKYTMNFLMNLCHQWGIAAILCAGGWFVVLGKTEVGTVVAFVSGLRTVKDPWDDLTTWYQTMMVTSARYKLLNDTLEGRPRDVEDDLEAEEKPSA